MNKKLVFVKWFLVVVFFAAGAMKFVMPELEREMFRVWGYPDWFRIVIGAWEMVAALLLIKPNLTKYVAGVLSLEMIGAVITHIRVDQFEQLPLPVALLVMSAILFKKLK